MNQNVIFQLLQETDICAKYDTEAKKLLGNKEILARIVKYSIAEFSDYSISTIINSIEGEPIIARKRVRPPSNIIGRTNTDSEIGAGEVTYDIYFHIITQDKGRTKVIINIEMQNDYYPGYDLVTRGVFYCARMLSSQQDTEFSGDNYDDIKKVYSIWICKNPPEYGRHTITEYKVVPNELWGNFKGKGRHDLLSVIMVRLGETKGAINPLIKLLDTILSDKLSVEHKQKVLETEFCIPRNFDKNGGLSKLCNLSMGIAEEAVKKGVKQGVKQGIKQERINRIQSMIKKGKTKKEILEWDYTEKEYAEAEKELLQPV